MFTVIIPFFNQFDEGLGYLESWFSLSKGLFSIILIDNGSDELLSDRSEITRWKREGHGIKVVRNNKNTGVYPTFQQGYELAAPHRPWLLYSHSDVEMLVPGWDERLRELLEIAASRNAGACGMFGAKGIGTPDIYRSLYDYRQMVRWQCHTVESMASAGGAAITGDLEQVMVLDGFALIVNRQFIDHMGGFKYDQYPVHHMYDNDICLESHYGGFNNYVLDLDCIHHGGMTSTREKWAEEMGTTDHAIHRKAHKVFYDKWRGKLPVSIT